ncbi:MAG: DUF6491 family protein [Proteobacteria bacterium]|nr:DUF6491 family protein [Pseudomonadota bacterium]
MKARLTAILTILPFYAFALPPEEHQPAGEAVTSIPNAGQILAFSTLDQKRVEISTQDNRQYILTLNSNCQRLPNARHVAISATNDTIWAGFDYITADGMQCRIGTIQKL